MTARNHHPHPLDRIRLERAVERLIENGGAYPARIVTEAFLDVATRTDGLPAVLDVLAKYRRLTPAMVRAAGGDRPTHRPLAVVPR